MEILVFLQGLHKSFGESPRVITGFLQKTYSFDRIVTKTLGFVTGFL